jgi:prepilin-type N-terminal cleavage/methylation domain-containing protein
MQTSSTSHSSRGKKGVFELGFTLVELLVSVAIVTLIMTIVIVNQSRYSEATVLSNTVSSLALAAREAQVYGVSVREVSAGSNEFTAGYGLEFNLSGGTNDAYIGYADRGAKNYMYDGDWSCPVGGLSECLYKTTLQSNLVISAICSIDTSDNEDCTLSRAAVTFVRPDTDAHLALFSSSGFQLATTNIKAVRIKITSPSNVTRSVYMYTTGQISIQ